MTPQELEAFGLKYYGASWVTPLAEELFVNRSTVWRWVTSKTSITPQVLASITLLERKLRRRKKPKQD